MKNPLSILLFLAITAATATPVLAADADTVYGSELMTNQERIEHRERLLNAKNEQEREKIRNEHHKRMQIRAKEQGVKIPDEPQMQGKGMNQGSGAGSNMGKGNR